MMMNSLLCIRTHIHIDMMLYMMLYRKKLKVECSHICGANCGTNPIQFMLCFFISSFLNFAFADISPIDMYVTPAICGNIKSLSQSPIDVQHKFNALSSSSCVNAIVSNVIR